MLTASQAVYAQSNKDFISKYSIALKEALKDFLKDTPIRGFMPEWVQAASHKLRVTNETLYWIKIMIKSDLVSKTRFQKMIEENERIIKILTASINKLKQNNQPR
ncbi:MAG: four helix bundle protein [Waterburya sp.]